MPKMAYRVISKSQWKSFFEVLSRVCEGHEIQLEIMSKEIGDQIETEGALVHGFSYFPKEDVLYVYTESLEHKIIAPKEILLIETEGHVAGIGVRDNDDTLEILSFQEPVVIERFQDSTEEFSLRP